MSLKLIIAGYKDLMMNTRDTINRHLYHVATQIITEAGIY